MKPLFDFGMSQEDAFSEQASLNLQSNDRLLCIASAGEIPLNLASMNKDLHADAVDISMEQLILCRLKLVTALVIGAPENAAFLGYMKMDQEQRLKIFEKLLPLLESADQLFWKQNIYAIKKGVINYGRFEMFLQKLRVFAQLIIGRRNLNNLINCSTIRQQEEIFEKKIAKRKALRILFTICFHPKIYTNRGLKKQGLIHASGRSGEIFYNKFRLLCTGSRASENYFLQYFLLGACKTGAIPEYLKNENREILRKNSSCLSFSQLSIQDALVSSPGSCYNKIHLSNIGDWMSVEDFRDLLNTIHEKVPKNGKISYRYLQKNHFENPLYANFWINESMSTDLERKDRFPFYSLLPVSFYEQF